MVAPAIQQPQRQQDAPSPRTSPMARVASPAPAPAVSVQPVTGSSASTLNPSAAAVQFSTLITELELIQRARERWQELQETMGTEHHHEPQRAEGRREFRGHLEEGADWPQVRVAGHRCCERGQAPDHLGHRLGLGAQSSERGHARTTRRTSAYDDEVPLDVHQPFASASRRTSS